MYAAAPIHVQVSQIIRLSTFDYHCTRILLVAFSSYPIIVYSIRVLLMFSRGLATFFG